MLTLCHRYFDNNDVNENDARDSVNNDHCSWSMALLMTIFITKFMDGNILFISHVFSTEVLLKKL